MYLSGSVRSTNESEDKVSGPRARTKNYREIEVGKNSTNVFYFFGNYYTVGACEICNINICRREKRRESRYPEFVFVRKASMAIV
jgi:hypothetical protein